MNKIISTKKISATFLAFVLVAGTFALMSSSFMVEGVQAEPGYDKPKYPSYKSDYNYYKSKDNSVSIKKVNCNNVNLNVNDASINVGRPPVGDFTTLDAASSDETESQGITANNFANGERPNNYGFKKDKDGFVYVCINNNNNAGQGEDGELNQCAEDIRACFEEFTGLQFVRLSAALESQAGLTVEINGEDVTLRSFADICEALEGLTYEQIEDAVGAILTEITPPPQIPVIRSDLIDCIAEALGIPAQGPG